MWFFTLSDHLLMFLCPHGKKNERTGINPKEDAALPIGVLEPSSTGQQDAKADLLCIQAPNEVNTLSLFTPALMQFHPPNQMEVWQSH